MEVDASYEYHLLIATSSMYSISYLLSYNICSCFGIILSNMHSNTHCRHIILLYYMILYYIYLMCIYNIMIMIHVYKHMDKYSYVILYIRTIVGTFVHILFDIWVIYVCTYNTCILYLL